MAFCCFLHNALRYKLERELRKFDFCSFQFPLAFRRDAKNNFVGMAELSSRLLDSVNNYLQKS